MRRRQRPRSRNVYTVLHYVRPFLGRAIGSLVFTVALAAVALAEPWPLAFLIDGVLGSDEIPGWVTGIAGESTGRLVMFAVLMSLAITALAGGLAIINQYLTTTVQLRMVLDLRSDMLAHAQRLSLAYHDDAEMGDLMHRINTQATALGSIMVAIPSLILSVLRVVGMGFIAFKIDPMLGLLALAVVPFVSLSTRYYTNRVEPELVRVRGMEGRNLSIVHESLAMLKVILAFGRTNHEWNRFRKQGEETVDARVQLTVKQTLFGLAVNLLTAAGTAAVLGVGATRVLDGQLTVGELLVMVAYVAAVYQPLTQLTATVAGFQQDFVALDHALDILSTRAEVVEAEHPVVMTRAQGAVSIRNVCFGYDDRRKTIDDVSLEIPAGSSLAIVGPTGAGKSTLMAMLSRFHDPQSGQVLLDGVDLRMVSIDSLRAQFSIVPQEPLLFSASIADNIRYGRPDASLDDVIEAAQRANAHTFISNLPDQYDTVLGEGGAKVSGGERQRISIARAFLRDAPVLLLDEPTSAIDSRTEAVIVDALERLMEGRTTVLIAHRLSTVRSVDQILVLDGGRTVQVGSHDELLATGGLYEELWRAQTGGAEQPVVAAPVPVDAQNWAQRAIVASATSKVLAGLDESNDRPKKSRPKLFTTDVLRPGGALDFGRRGRQATEPETPKNRHVPWFRQDLALREPGSTNFAPSQALSKAVLKGAPPSSLPAVGEPRVSVVMVASGDTEADYVANRLAIESVLVNSSGYPMELIVIARTANPDFTWYLRAMSLRDARVQLIEDSDAPSDVAAVDQGLALARGTFFVLGSGGSLVPRRWIPQVIRPLRDERVGLVVPNTDRQRGHDYETYWEFLNVAETASRKRKLVDVDDAPITFASMTRNTWRSVGPLAQHASSGLFTPEDYPLRVRRAGFRVVEVPGCVLHPVQRQEADELNQMTSDHR